MNGQSSRYTREQYYYVPRDAKTILIDGEPWTFKNFDDDYVVMWDKVGHRYKVAVQTLLAEVSALTFTPTVVKDYIVKVIKP